MQDCDTRSRGFLAPAHGKSTIYNKSTCKSAQQDKGLISEVGLHPASQGADMMLHVGDFAYDLDSDGGKVGDQFMVNIEQIAAYTPYSE